MSSTQLTWVVDNKRITRQHCHVHICFHFCWAWRQILNQKQIQITIWWWDEQVCPEDNSLSLRFCILSRVSLWMQWLPAPQHRGRRNSSEWRMQTAMGNMCGLRKMVSSNSLLFPFSLQSLDGRCYVDQDSPCPDAKPSITGSPYRWAFCLNLPGELSLCIQDQCFFTQY